MKSQITLDTESGSIYIALREHRRHLVNSANLQTKEEINRDGVIVNTDRDKTTGAILGIEILVP